MPSMIMTVQLINPPGSPNERGNIVGTNGERLGVFTEKVDLFEVGKTYEIEYTEKQQGNRKLRNVRSAKPVAGTPPAAATHATPAAAAAGASFRTPEQLSAIEITCAYIAAGKCANPADLKRTMQEAVNAFRAIWPPEEVADHYKVAAE